MLRRSLLLLTLLLPLPLAAGPLAQAGPDIDLPRVGTLGQAPSGEEVVVVNVTGDGGITISGRGPLSLEEVQEALLARTTDPKWREPDHSSKRVLLVNADASVPWVVCQWIMQVAAHPQVQIYRIFFGARPREGAQVGAIGWLLPKDRGLQPTAQHVDAAPTLSVKLFARPGHATSDPEALFAEVARLKAGGVDLATVHFTIKTPRPYGTAVPTGFVLRVVDVLTRAGARHLSFEGAAPPMGPMAAKASWFKSQVASIKAEGGVPYIRVGQRVLGERPENVPVPEAAGLLPRPHGVGLQVGTSSVEEEPLGEMQEEDLGQPSELEEDPGASDNGVIGLGGGAGGAFRGRGGRGDLGSGPGRSEKAVTEALRWLAAHQSSNGSWQAEGFGAWCNGKIATDGPDGAGKAIYDVGTTGLALLAFLGAGHSNRGSHPFAKNVGRGLRHLKSVQDGEGCIGTRSHPNYVYNHAVAALAMVEAYGLTQSPMFKSSAQQALDFIAMARNPYFAWRYGVKPGDNDTSVTGWMTSVLWAARRINDEAKARGKPAPLRIDDEAAEGVRNWLDKMTDPDYGRTGYIQRGGSSARSMELIDRFPGDKSESMTGAGILMRVALGEDPRASKVIQRGATLMSKLPPMWNANDGSIDMYYWYYGSLAMYQMGGHLWTTWHQKLKGALFASQRRDGDYCSYKGSWDPAGPWGADGGRVYSTALMALCLETPKRYARVFEDR